MKQFFLAFVTLCLLFTEAGAQKKIKGLCSTKLGKYMEAKNDRMDTTAPRGMIDNYYLWPVGATLTIKFMPGGSKQIRNEVISYAKEWEKYANVKLNFVPDNYTGKTNVRIKLNDNDGAWSLLGTQCNYEDEAYPTMNLDTVDFRTAQDFPYWRATVIHEFGHTLGFMHEQSYPGGIKWNKPVVYAYYAKYTNWTPEDVDAQVFNVNDIFYANGTAYDSKSIMQYWVSKYFTLDSVEIPANYTFSAGDITLAAAMYPKTGKRFNEVPTVSVSNLSDIKVEPNKARGGIVIAPSFNLKSNSKLGLIYLVARVVDANNYYVETSTDQYSWGGWLAAYKDILVLPNSNITYNKTGSPRNLELFIPYSEIPLENNSQIRIEFFIRLADGLNKKYKDIGFKTYTQLVTINK
jgi:hypothetical protein